MVLSLTAKGLTSGEIVAYLAEVYGMTTTKETVSTITDKSVTGVLSCPTVTCRLSFVNAPIGIHTLTACYARGWFRRPLHGIAPNSDHVTLELHGEDAGLAAAGPEQFGIDDLIRTSLAAKGNPREVVTDPENRYFGAALVERTLLPGDGAAVFETRFANWLAAQSAK